MDGFLVWNSKIENHIKSGKAQKKSEMNFFQKLRENPRIFIFFVDGDVTIIVRRCPCFTFFAAFGSLNIRNFLYIKILFLFSSFFFVFDC